MIVILMNDQLLSPNAVCQGCLMADQGGQPRWRQGQLGCGRLVERCGDEQPQQYECQMGFRLVNIE